MTLPGLFASLAWTATAVLFVARLDRFAHRWLDTRTPDANPLADNRPEIPTDLQALALSEDGGSDEATKQAQQSVTDAIYDAWRRYKDWNKVRAAMGIGAMDA